MSLYNDLKATWKKQAAVIPPPDEEVESTFSSLAFEFIQNKSKALMNPKYRIGFEVVYKNEEGNRLVGLFAFKVHGKLIYAPVFFLNGEIKGIDLLYRHDIKKFFPNQSDWIDWILHAPKKESGKGIDKHKSRKSISDFETQRLAHPPMSKSGSVPGKVLKGFRRIDADPADVEMTADFDREALAGAIVQALQEQLGNRELNPDTNLSEQGFDELDRVEVGISIEDLMNREDPDWERATELDSVDDLTEHYSSMSKKASTDRAPRDMKKLSSLAWKSMQGTIAKIPEFRPILKDFIVEDGGVAAIDLLGQAFEKDAAFADALYELCDETTYCPPELLERSKKAHTETRPALVLHRGLGGIKNASADEIKNGFRIEDNRDTAAEVLFVDYEESDCRLSGVDMPGSYELVMEDGSQTEGLLVPVCHCGGNGIPESSYYGDTAHTEHLFINLEDKSCATVRTPDGVGKLKRGISELEEAGVLQELPKGGGLYCLYDTGNNRVSHPLKVKKVESGEGGIKTLHVARNEWCEDTITYHPDRKSSDLENGKIGPTTRFIKMKAKKGDEYCCETSISPGTGADITAYLTGFGHKSASVAARENGFFQIKLGNGAVTPEMNRMHSLLYLMSQMDFREDSANAVLDGAEQRGTYNCMWKSASVSAYPEPHYDPGFDTMFNIPLGENIQHTISTAFNPPTGEPGHRIGDAYDPTMGANSVRISDITLFTTSPVQLAEMARSMNLPQVFEHGAVGSLIKTFDAISMLDKYIPKLEDALDAMGRIIFLYYWKPEDFDRAYGANDAQDQEDIILSTFKQLGELTISLKQRVTSLTDGSPGMR